MGELYLLTISLDASLTPLCCKVTNRYESQMTALPVDHELNQAPIQWQSELKSPTDSRKLTLSYMSLLSWLLSLVEESTKAPRLRTLALLQHSGHTTKTDKGPDSLLELTALVQLGEGGSLSRLQQWLSYTTIEKVCSICQALFNYCSFLF